MHNPHLIWSKWSLRDKRCETFKSWIKNAFCFDKNREALRGQIFKKRLLREKLWMPKAKIIKAESLDDRTLIFKVEVLDYLRRIRKTLSGSLNQFTPWIILTIDFLSSKSFRITKNEDFGREVYWVWIRSYWLKCLFQWINLPIQSTSKDPYRISAIPALMPLLFKDRFRRRSLFLKTQFFCNLAWTSEAMIWFYSRL